MASPSPLLMTTPSQNYQNYQPTITEVKEYVVSISSDGIKTYGAMLSGKASYFTDSRHELVVKYSKSTLNTYIENKIQIPQSGDWTFQTGALEKGEYVFSVTQYLESQEKWVESTPVSLNINGNRRIIGILCILGFVVLSFIYNCFLLKRIHNERVQLKRVILFLLSFAGCFLYLFIDIKKNWYTFDAFELFIRFGTGFSLVFISIFFLASLFIIIKEIVQGRRIRRLEQEIRRLHQQRRRLQQLQLGGINDGQAQHTRQRLRQLGSLRLQLGGINDGYSRVNNTEDVPLENPFQSTRSSDLKWLRDPKNKQVKQQIQRELQKLKQKQQIEVIDFITHQLVKDPVLGDDFAIYDVQSLKGLKGHNVRGSRGNIVKKKMSLPQAVQLYKAQTDQRKKGGMMKDIAKYVALLEKLNAIPKESKQGQRQGS